MTWPLELLTKWIATNKKIKERKSFIIVTNEKI